jgi:hypothetical protein
MIVTGRGITVTTKGGFVTAKDVTVTGKGVIYRMKVPHRFR